MILIDTTFADHAEVLPRIETILIPATLNIVLPIDSPTILIPGTMNQQSTINNQQSKHQQQ